MFVFLLGVKFLGKKTPEAFFSKCIELFHFKRAKIFKNASFICFSVFWKFVIKKTKKYLHLQNIFAEIYGWKTTPTRKH